MDEGLFQGDIVTSKRILYTPSPFARNALLYLQETGELKAKKPHVSHRQGLASYLFFMVLEGHGTLRYQDRTYTLGHGDCVFLDCRQEHFHQSSEDLWRLKWAHFNGPNMDAVYDKYLERGGVPCFHTQKAKAFNSILEELFEVASSSSYVRDMKICEKLTSLLTVLMEEAWNPDRAPHVSEKRRNLQRIKNYLDQNYQYKITLDQLSEQFYINKFYLSKIFSEQYGMTINRYLLELRITQAKRLLRFTSLPIEKIAVECGIPDSNYFARIFKKIEGIAPGEYRKKW